MMKTRRNHVGRFFLGWLSILSVGLNACTYWRPTEITPATLVNEGRTREVRVTTREGLEAVLTGPVVKGDSLIGFGGGGTEQRQAPRRIAIALGDIQRLSLREVDLAQSLGATVVVGLAVLGTAFGGLILMCSNNGCD